MPRQRQRRRPQPPPPPPPNRKPANSVPPAQSNALTEALWEQLREHRCNGFRFQRQAAVFGGVAEFYCAAARLVVEVVGRSRRVASGADALNNQALTDAGLRILRVPAGVVARDPRTAARLVADALMESGHAPGTLTNSRYHFGPGPVGDRR